MTVYSFHIFDRKGKTLFTKRYNSQYQSFNPQNESEQRKLIFGMIFSIREIVGTLAPMNDGFSEPTVLQSVKTGACTLHVYETMSGMRLVMYTDNFKSTDKRDSSLHARESLRYIYSNIWVEYVVRSPLYRPGDISAVGGKSKMTESWKKPFDIKSTEFEKKLDDYLSNKSFY